MKTNFVLSLSLGLISLILTAAAVAEASGGGAEAADASSSPDSAAGSMQEVLVTAQKRSENIQAVPISISAIGASQLQSERIANYDDISRTVPGVSFNSVGANEGLTNIVIRGVSSTSGSATVGVYLDDVSVTVKNFYDGSSQPRIFDLERIEVLRGPQGTLWGASSEGGTIRFVTKQPNMNTFSSELTGDLSNTDHATGNYSGGAIVNVPIIPGTFALRGSVGYMYDSGYVDHFTQAGRLDRKGVNAEHAFVARLTGKITPTDDLTITPAFFYQRDKTDDNAAFYPAMGLWSQDKQVIEFGDDTLILPSLTVEKGLGFAELTSVTGLFLRQFNRQQDGTFYNSTIFATAFLDPLYPDNTAQNDSIIGNLRSPVRYTTHYGQVSQELRLSSRAPQAGDLPLKWVAGLYYADQWIHNINFQQIQGINTAFQQIYGFPMEQSAVNSAYNSTGVPQLFPNDVDEADNRTYDEKQYAVFGQVDYDILPRLHGAVGLRYVKADVKFHSEEYGFYQIGNISPYDTAPSFHALTPKFSLAFDVDSGSSVYASASKGFRLGGPTGPIVFGPDSVCATDFAAIGVTQQPTRFGSDQLWSYELGSKNLVADRKLAVNGAGYYTTWKDIQQQIYLPTCGYYFTANVGDAEIYGGELEVSFRPMAGLALGATASYQHAVVTRSNNPATVSVGQHLVDVPYSTYTASVQYDKPIAAGFSFTSGVDYDWTGHSYGSYQVDNSNYYNPSYGVLNASFGVRTEKYDISLYAKNLTNDRTIIQHPQINTVIEGYTVRPRTVGLTARMLIGR